MIKKFDEFSKLNEDGEGGGGVSAVTLGNTGGMGAIVSAQPSSIPGDVAGSTKGSGDIGQPLGTFTKQPALGRKKRKKKDKESKVGPGIDKFYVTNYKESNVSSSNLVQNWQAFTEGQKNTLKEKDQWWDENYDRLIRFVNESPLPMEMVVAMVPSYETNWNESTGKNNALAFLNMFTIEEIEEELRQFEESDFDPDDYSDPYDDMGADDEEMNEGSEYIMPIEVGKIYAVDSDKKGSYGQVLTDIYLGKNEHMFYKIGQIRRFSTVERSGIFYPEFRYIESGNLMSIPLVDLKGKIRGVTEEEKEDVITQLKKDKKFGGLREDVVTYYDLLKKIVGTELN